MIYRFLRDHQERFRVSLMCSVLGISRSSFYAWGNRPESPRRQQNRILLQKIKKVYHATRAIYGYPRIHRELQQQGEQCGLSDAMQEAPETQTWLEFSQAYGYIDHRTHSGLDARYEQILAMLNSMEKKAESFCLAKA